MNWKLRNVNQISNITRRILGATYDYENVAVDVWIEMWCAHGCTDDGRVPCPNIVIRCRCVDARRARYVQQKHDEAVDDISRPELDYSVLDLAAVILSRAGLQQRQEELVIRYYIHKQSVHDIAESLKLSEEATRKQLNIALDKLKSAMRSTET